MSARRTGRLRTGHHQGDAQPCGHCDQLVFDSDVVVLDRLKPGTEYCSTLCATLAIHHERKQPA